MNFSAFDQKIPSETIATRKVQGDSQTIDYGSGTHAGTIGHFPLINIFANIASGIQTCMPEVSS